ncbi:TPA: hypothetical protein LA460_000314 [Clostridium botulinum]|nr:hypothetical protein [Clostridium botulinum]HBJ1652918.1 hypothetical protein [Clostridium botulinum]
MTSIGLISIIKEEEYEKNCERYDEIIQMFKELGTGKLERRDVLNNITNMINNDLINKLENLVDDIEYYEDGGM